MSNRLTTERVLRALSRFDAATVEDIANATHGQKRSVWSSLQRLVEDGYATRDGGAKCVATYTITDEGRAQITRAA